MADGRGRWALIVEAVQDNSRPACRSLIISHLTSPHLTSHCLTGRTSLYYLILAPSLLSPGESLCILAASTDGLAPFVPSTQCQTGCATRAFRRRVAIHARCAGPWAESTIIATQPCQVYRRVTGFFFRASGGPACTLDASTPPLPPGASPYEPGHTMATRGPND